MSEPEKSDDIHSYSNINTSLVDAYLDGLVMAREILWLEGRNDYLRLIEYRLRSRYGIELFKLKSPVAGD